MYKKLVFSVIALLLSSPVNAELVTMDELPYQNLDGVSLKGVTFSIADVDAWFNERGGDSGVYISRPVSRGITAFPLTLDFSSPTSFLNFGFLLGQRFSPGDDGVSVELFDSALNSLGTYTADTSAQTINGFEEGIFSVAVNDINRAVIKFGYVDPEIYGWFIDNLEFEDAPATGPVCDIQLNQFTYIDGDRVTADVFRLANLSSDPVATEIKIWLGVPGGPPISVLNLGADGRFLLPAGTDIDFGPLQLYSVDASFPRGDYEFSCRMLDPVTGELLAENSYLLAEDRNHFSINPINLIHDEQVDGDLDFQNLRDLGSFGAGSHLVTGSVTFGGCPSPSTEPFCLLDIDAFTFSRQTDLVLDVAIDANIEVTIPPERFGDVTGFGIFWELNGVELTWGAESINTPRTNRVENLGGIFNGTYNFFQTPTNAFTYAGPDLLEDERVTMNYSILLSIRPPQ